MPALTHNPLALTPKTLPPEDMPMKRLIAHSLIALAAATGGAAYAQYDADQALRDWQEAEVPAPPAWNTKNLVDVAQRPYSTLQTAVDVDSVTVGPDTVVRFVLYTKSKESGLQSAYYYGIRCQTWQVRTYARNDGQGWSNVGSPWVSLYDTHSRTVNDLAKKGACDNLTPPSSTTEARKAIQRGTPTWMGHQ